MSEPRYLWEEDLPPELRPPRDNVEDNMAFRVGIMDRCNRDPLFRELIMNLCAKSFYFTQNTFAYTLDPRNRFQPVIPFVQWDVQVELSRGLMSSIMGQKDFFIEKSRDMGATWTCCSFTAWAWLFTEQFHGLLGSYIQDRVDGKAGSMMRMVDFWLEHLPHFMMPAGYNKHKHRTFLKMINPDNDSVIEGEATTGDFGRGERKTLILFDEFARWGNRQAGMDAEAWEGAADVTASRWALSTPQGTTNHYYYLRNLYAAGTLDGYTMPFYGHPNRMAGARSILETREVTSDWLERERPRRTMQYIEQEVLIKYLGQGSTAFPDSQGWIDDQVRLLKQRIVDDEYGEPFELIIDYEAREFGTMVKGCRRVRIDDPPHLLIERMTDPRTYEGTPGLLWVFKEPDVFWQGRTVISSDQSEGLASGDMSAIHVIDRETLEVLAMWKGRENANVVAEIMSWLDKRYSAYLAPEANPVGQACIMRLRDIYGPKIKYKVYHTETIGKDREERTDRLGFITTRRTKPQMIEQIAAIFRQQEVKINCLQTAIELFNYERTPAGVFRGAPPYKDDCVMSYCIGLLAATSEQFPPARYLGKVEKKEVYVPRITLFDGDHQHGRGVKKTWLTT